MMIKISEIKVNPNRRKPDLESVQSLAKSITALTLLNPITIDQNHELIAGLHRLEAAKLLGWEEIPCNVCDLDGLQKELAEIDENIVRRTLDYMEECTQLARRKVIYETLHPETKQGQRNGQTSKTAPGAVLETKSFSEDTAEKLGIHERTVRKKVKMGRDLTPETKKIVKENSIPVKKALKLSNLSPEQQEAAAMQLASGDIDTVEEYLEQNRQIPSCPEEAVGKLVSDVQSDSGAVQTEDAVPIQPPDKQYPTIKASVADLKNMDKDCSCTPDSFLWEVTAFVKKFRQEIAWYVDPYYVSVFCRLSDQQILYLRQQLDLICADAKNFYEAVERKNKNELSEKA